MELAQLDLLEEIKNKLGALLTSAAPAKVIQLEPVVEPKPKRPKDPRTGTRVRRGRAQMNAKRWRRKIPYARKFTAKFKLCQKQNCHVKLRSNKAMWCDEHRVKIRAEQTRRNNRAYRARQQLLAAGQKVRLKRPGRGSRPGPRVNRKPK